MGIGGLWDAVIKRVSRLTSGDKSEKGTRCSAKR